MYLKSPLNVLVMISALLKWTSAGVALNLCVWTKLMSNGEAHHSFLRHDPTQRSLRLYHSVWTKERALVNCAWNDESAVTKDYMSACKRRGREFSEYQTDERFDINQMLELNSPCAAAVTSTTTTAAEGAERTRGGRHARSIAEQSVGGSVSVQSVYGDADGSERDAHRRVKRGFIVPGTLWCGSGNKATTYSDLGVFSQTDSCCREHDHCQETILSFRINYGVFNTNIFTMSHCDCDHRFRECLRVSEDSISDVVGYTFFNVLGLRCFELTQALQCARRNWFGMCQLEEMALSAVVYPATEYNSTNPSPDEDNMAITFDINVTAELTVDPQRSSTPDPASPSAAPHSPDSPSLAPASPAPPGLAPASPDSPSLAPASPDSPSLAPASPASPSAAPASPASPSAAPDSPSAAPASPSAAPHSPASPSTAPASPAPPSLAPASPDSPSLAPASPASPSAAPASPASPSAAPDSPSAAPDSPSAAPASPSAAPHSPASPSTAPASPAPPSLAPASPDSPSAAPHSPASPSAAPASPAFPSASPASPSAAPHSPASPSTAPASPASTTSRTDAHTAAPDSPALSAAPPTPGTSASELDLSTPRRQTDALPVDSQEKEPHPPTQDPGAARTTQPTTYTSLPVPEWATVHTDGERSCELYRQLDECRMKIPPRQQRYGLHNPESGSLYHCNCTSRLFQALGEQEELSWLQNVLLEHLSQSCFTLQPQHCTASCTAVLVQSRLPQPERRRVGADVEEWRHLQVVRLKVRRPGARRAKRKDRAVRLYRLCLRLTRPKIPKTRRLHLLGAHSGLP